MFLQTALMNIFIAKVASRWFRLCVETSVAKRTVIVRFIRDVLLLGQIRASINDNSIGILYGKVLCFCLILESN